MQDTPRLLRTREAAAQCGFSKSTFEKLRLTGGGSRFIKRGSAVYYDVTDLDDWLAALPRYRSTSEADAAQVSGAAQAEAKRHMEDEDEEADADALEAV